MKSTHLLSFLLLTSCSVIVSDLFFPAQAATGNARTGGAKARKAVSPKTRPSGVAVARAGAPAGKAGNTHADLHSHTREELMVSSMRRTGAGATETMTRVEMDKFVQGSSPMMMLSRKPGINFVANDPLGVDTWGSSLYMRGFQQSQLGVTLDGVPLGAQDYYTYNGQSINFSILSDNIERMDVSDGGGDVEVPSTTNLGGSIQITSADPHDHYGGKVSQMFGSYNAFRTYARVDSGRLNASGTKFMVSYARSDGNKWKGSGEQFDQQMNAKIVQPIGQESSIKAFFNWNDATQFNYADQTIDMLKRLGHRNDYYYPNYNAAYQAAEGIFSGALAQYNALPGSDALDASYFDGVTHAVDYLGGLNAHLVLNRHLEWNSVFYGQAENHWGTWTTPYVPSPSGSLLSEQVNFGGNQKFGFTSAIRYQIAKNTIDTGVWYENNRYHIDQYMYAQPFPGEGTPVSGVLHNFGTPFQHNWGENFNTNTFQFHLEDTYRPLSTLTLKAGFKSMLVTTVGGATANDADYNGQSQLANGSLTSAKAFLPHFNAVWHFLPGHEVYFDIARNMRAYSYGGYQLGSAFGGIANQETFNSLKNTLRPETAWVYDVGYRYNSNLITGSLNLYHADFSNRLQNLTAGTITQPVSTVVNVGSVSMYGVDAAFTVRPIRNLSITNSISYNHSTYGDNIQDQGVTYNLAGKKVIAYPQLMYKANITYAYRAATIYLDTNYMSKRYFSYINDMSVPGYWMTSMGASYKFGKVGPLRNLKFDLNIYNLTNISYISQIGENGFPLSGDYQSALAGSPRTYFGTISTEF
ncbi:MAG: TonB-dependent receptor [Acetobacter sp.]